MKRIIVYDSSKKVLLGKSIIQRVWSNVPQIIPNSPFRRICCGWCLSLCCLNDKEANTSSEYEAFETLRQETQVKYDEKNEKHERRLKKFYDKGQEFFSDEQRENEIPWKVYGFQFQVPRRDFGGGGFHSLLFMRYLAKHFPHLLLKLFQLQEVSLVLVSNTITFSLRCFLLLEKGTKPSSITRKQMKCFVYNLVKEPKSLLFKMEAEIFIYYLKRISQINPNCISQMEITANLTVNLINDAISICGKALNNPIELHLYPFIAHLHNRLKQSQDSDQSLRLY